MDEATWRRFKEAAREWARQSTFEAKVEQLEAICRRIPGAWPNRSPGDRPALQSRAWYAEEIIFAISAARHHIASKDGAYAAAEALTIGALAVEAGAKFGWQDISGWLKHLDNESKEQWLVGEVLKTVAAAGQISGVCSDKRFGLDMEVELRDDEGKPTGERVYLQLKSGDSHLKRRKTDGAEIFRIRHPGHAKYWMSQSYPVFLLIADSQGVRWMEIRDHLRHESGHGTKIVRQIAFAGEHFTVQSLHRWRRKVLAARA